MISKKEFFKYLQFPKNKQEYNKQANWNARFDVIMHYSKETRQCACCGEKIYEFLSIDHINGGGKQHRKQTGQGLAFYRWLIKNNFPVGFRILCMNCNHSLGHYGYCPHTKNALH